MSTAEKSELCSQIPLSGAGMSDLGKFRARLAPNGTNMGLYKDQFRLVSQNVLETDIIKYHNLT